MERNDNDTKMENTKIIEVFGTDMENIMNVSKKINEMLKHREQKKESKSNNNDIEEPLSNITEDLEIKPCDLCDYRATQKNSLNTHG